MNYLLTKKEKLGHWLELGGKEETAGDTKEKVQSKGE